MNPTNSPIAVNEKSCSKNDSMTVSGLSAGAAISDITPKNPQFLWGYPHVERTSTGVHDPLLASALCLDDGTRQTLFIGCDILMFSKSLAARARARITAATGIPESHIVISATHTHSGPLTENHLIAEADPAVPPADEEYIKFFEDGIVEAACKAAENRVPAEAALIMTNVSGLGTNRHDPNGPADQRVPVLMVRHSETHRPLGLMISVCMHPTVLHEDSTLISGDFPGLARQYLQTALVGKECPVVYHTGPAGNQSPRYVTRGNTFAEAQRLGEILGRAVETALAGAEFTRNLPITILGRQVDLPSRQFISSDEAVRNLTAARERLLSLQKAGAPRTEVRTAECDLFGAEESVVLARAAEEGRTKKVLAESLPAEIQVIALGSWTFVAWPGEAFVEFSLEVAKKRPNTFMISLANGTLQGYLVTREAVEGNWYEAGNAMVSSPESGDILLAATEELLKQLPAC